MFAWLVWIAFLCGLHGFITVLSKEQLFSKSQKVLSWNPILTKDSMAFLHGLHDTGLHFFLA